MLLRNKIKKAKECPLMNRIAQEVAFRLAVVRYAERHGPSQAAIQYRVSRMTVYRWRKRYDGTKESLVPR